VVVEEEEEEVREFMVVDLDVEMVPRLVDEDIFFVDSSTLLIELIVVQSLSIEVIVSFQAGFLAAKLVGLTRRDFCVDIFQIYLP